MPSKKPPKNKVHVSFEDLDSSPEKKIKKNTPKNKIKYSNFFITLNTNLRYKKGDEQRRQARRDFVNGFKTVLSNIGDYVEFLNDGSWDDVEKADVKIRPEIGTKKGLIHGHALVRLRHRTKLRIPYAKLRQAFEDEGAVVKGGKYHMKVIVANDNMANIEDYINKTVKKKNK